MHLSRKCQYALRAIYELARRDSTGPVRIGEIAAAQAIPQRFLEAILAELRQAGLVRSRRGSEGGYALAKRPDEIRVGDIIRSIDGPLGPRPCLDDSPPNSGDCAYEPLWRQVREALADIVDGATIEDIRRMADRQAQDSLDFVI